MTWVDWVADATQTVVCTGEQHRLRWSRGKLTLTDHPDLLAWQALSVLRGERIACLRVLHYWREAIKRPEFLLEWARARNTEAERRHEYAQWGDWTEDESDELLDVAPLAVFTDDLLDRLALAAIARGARARRDGFTGWRGPATIATERRLRRAFVDALTAVGVPTSAAALTPFRSRLGTHDDPTPTVRYAREGRSSSPTTYLTVSPWWMHRVWAAGLTGSYERHVTVDVDRDRRTVWALPVGDPDAAIVELPLVPLGHGVVRRVIAGHQ